MYTVLLVDDETTILDALSSCIPWQQFGVNTVLTATDGIQALDIISSNNVHLLITDIKMPRMDGITLLEKVFLSHPDIHCILLTAYSEFEYAKRALQLGVENYLLKPFQKEELEETIEKTLENIYTEKKSSRRLFQQNILFRWASGNISSEELSERANLLGINLYLQEYCAVGVSAKSPVTSLSGYCRKCIESLSDSYEVHYFIDEHTRAFFLIGSSSISSKELADCFLEAAKKTKHGNAITLTMGSVVPSAEQMPESYLPVIRLMDSADLSSSESVITKARDDFDSIETKLAQEIRELFQCNDEMRQQAFSDFASALLSNSDGDISKQALLLSDSLSRVFAQDFPAQPAALEQLHNRIHIFLQNPSEPSVVQLLEYSHLLYCYNIEQLSPIIQAAINYIWSNYADNIFIQDFCTKNRTNPAYLGSLFKKETGIFFNNYLTQYRICCSIKLLLSTDLKINDIAQNVGFSSPAYYISCFKKYIGISPVKYRKLHPKK